MAKEQLTERQRAILEYIQTRITGHGQSPTVREIGNEFGITSTNGVRAHIAALIKKGFLKKQALISRGLELTRELAGDVAHIPVVGSVPAGLPIDAIENIEGEVAVDLSFLPKGQTFTLRVDGDSMRDAGILNGDLLLVRKQETAQKGDIVVAILNGEATVKRYMPKGRTIVLQPENEAFEPIVVDRRSGEFRLAGKVAGLLRRFDH